MIVFLQVNIFIYNKKLTTFNLLQEYQKHLRTVPGEDASCLDETIHLLRHTQEMISLFSSRQPIASVEDERIRKCKSFLEYLRLWKSSTTNGRNFISEQLWFDLRAMVYGLEQVVRIKKKTFPNAVIKPIIVNQDVVENIFCQIRGFNAQNDHPNYALYSSTINTVNITQSTVSKKGNTGGSAVLLDAELPNPHPFKKSKFQ